MDNQLEKCFKELIDTKEKWNRRLSNKTVQQLNFKPGDKGWSMLEVYDHILISEEKILLLFEKRPPSETTYKVKKMDKFKNVLLSRLYKSAFRVNMPMDSLAPRGFDSLEELKNMSAGYDKQLKIVLDNFPSEKLKMSVFKHPVSGGMTMSNTIDFFNNHYKHHFHQLDRIEKHPDYPKN